MKRDLAALKTASASPNLSAADANELKQQIADLERRIRDVETEVNSINTDLGKEKTQIDDLDRKLQAMPGRIKAISDFIKARDDGFGKMKGLCEKIPPEARERTTLIQQLINRPPEQFKFKLGPSPINFAGERRATIDALNGFFKEDPDPKKAGLIVSLESRLQELEQQWASATPVIPKPSEWNDLKTSVVGVRTSLKEFQAKVSDPATEGTALFDGYRQELREFAKVDPATARHIRTMVWTGVFGDRGVFLLPMDDEIDKGDKVEAMIGPVVDDLKVTTTVLGGTKVIRNQNNSPVEILRFIFVHESGGSHVMNFGGREYVTIGIDWEQKGDRSVFTEHLTSPKRWSASRGWGLTQKTYFDEAEKIQDANGSVRDYQMQSGIPYVGKGDKVRPNPITIGTAKGNLSTGIRLFLSNFDTGTIRHRDCTFKQQFKCSECVKNFSLVPQGKFDEKTKKFVPKRQVSAIMFDDVETDFERIRQGGKPDGRAISYRLKNEGKQEGKLRKLLEGGNYTIAGFDPKVNPDAPLPEEHLSEFPCSWITAVIRYCGSGDQAYWYGMESMWTMAGKPAPPQPPAPQPQPSPSPPQPTPTGP
jgi:hypothetical protein